jgi:hypothetical protein
VVFAFWFSGKNHDSPERTTRGYRFNSQSEAEAVEQSQPKPAATSRRAKHGSRRIFGFCRRYGGKSQKDEGGCHEEEEGAQKA